MGSQIFIFRMPKSRFSLMGAFGIVARDAGIFQKQDLHFGAQNSWATGCVISVQIRI